MIKCHVCGQRLVTDKSTLFYPDGENDKWICKKCRDKKSMKFVIKLDDTCVSDKIFRTLIKSLDDDEEKLYEETY